MGIIFKDLFTEPTTDTALPSHTPTDNGTGYTEEANNTAFVINALTSTGKAKASGSKGSRRIVYSMQPDPAIAEYDVEIVQSTVDFFGLDDPFVLGGRWTDTSNKYGLSVRRSAVGSTATYEIFKEVSGTVTSLASTTTPLADGDDTKFEIRDAAKKGFKNGTEILSTTDNVITEVGKAFFGLGDVFVAGADVDSTWEFDDLRVTELDAGVATSFIPYKNYMKPLLVR
ncbi:MAG: hypothetical protein ACE5IR_27145 [bacterium]